MREALQLNVDASPLVGTYHRPAAGAPGSPAADRIGVLFFNSGYLPRSAAGDLAAQLADRLADLGYHVFRFDMPGLGDSPGELPPHVLPFFRFVAEGGHAACADSLVAILQRQFELRGLVLVGNCGGAITAVYAADRRRDKVLGVVQLDPDFDLSGSESVQAGSRASISARAGALARTARRNLRNRILQTPFGHAVRAVYLPAARTLRSSVRGVRQWIAGPSLPPRANLKLIQSWRNLAAAGMPMLVLMADKSKSNPGRFDYMRHLLRQRPPNVTHFEIRGTSHSFATGGGKDAVARHVEQWLGAVLLTR